MQASPIDVNHLTKRYGKHRGVEDLTFSVEPGEIFGFLGPNGAGKTTTIRVLIGLLKPTDGQARIFGGDCWRQTARLHRSIAFIPGDLRLYEGMSVLEFLRFMAGLHGGVRRGRIEGLTDRLELELHRKIKHLSKGNRQKVGLVQALMHEVPLFVLDEPSSGLDPLMEVTFLELLREERAAGRTVFLSSHNLSEVEKICDRVAIIRDGLLVALEHIDVLKAKRVRQMSIVFRQPVDPHAFEVDGVVVVDRGERRVTLRVRGEPSLEDVFLHYYQGVAEEASA